MTEEEAKQRWCPFMRISGSNDGLDTMWHNNRPSFGDVDVKGFDLCITSACMAWRGATKDVWVDPDGILIGAGGIAPDGSYKIKDDADGYCGLAGPLS